MSVDSIREYCLSFPHATEKLQWGDALCFKVREKMFAVLGFGGRSQRKGDLALRVDVVDPDLDRLTEREHIQPSPYLGRYKWVMLNRLDAVPWNELQKLIRQSYEMVAAKAPKKRPGKEQKAPMSRTRRKSKRG